MRSAACTACCCAVLSCLIDWIVVPCFVSVVSQTSRSTPLPLVVSNDITAGIAKLGQICFSFVTCHIMTVMANLTWLTQTGVMLNP